ncbi:hypothetical protein DPMN_191389 [Dreissena polymorpha]|uniref:Uncharacterized protein n=1 Tax=Dreissena polymorpha TaxID=45954 RepID=A0A9D3Y4Z3_DREPO|nr:hypothetical protein DPMN_191389 [Dreissena polymorpha]
MVSNLVKRGLHPAVPYSETLFCSCTFFLVYCTALKPQYLLDGYYKYYNDFCRCCLPFK